MFLDLSPSSFLVFKLQSLDGGSSLEKDVFWVTNISGLWLMLYSLFSKPCIGGFCAGRRCCWCTIEDYDRWGLPLAYLSRKRLFWNSRCWCFIFCSLSILFWILKSVELP